MEKGRKEGHEDGLKQGELKAKMELAKELLKVHDVEFVANITKLTIDEVEKLKNVKI